MSKPPLNLQKSSRERDRRRSRSRFASITSNRFKMHRKNERSGPGKTHRSQSQAIIGMALLLLLALNPAEARPHKRKIAANAPGKSGATPSQGLELISKADPGQSSATAGANLSQQLNQRAFSADGRYV